jgi:hypothetical protein
MSIKRIIYFGILNIAGCLLWNLMNGEPHERASAMFGGGFSMLVTLALVGWATGK